MQTFGHRFVNHKSCEKICWPCGFVIDRDWTLKETRAFLVKYTGRKPWCGGAWHRQVSAAEYRNRNNSPKG